MAEFKKLSAVEAVNEVADTANVLIEENGIIKKAPKSAVGGVASSENYYIVVSSEKYSSDSNGDIFAEYVTDGMYEAIGDLIASFNPINIQIFIVDRKHNSFSGVGISSLQYEDNCYKGYAGNTTAVEIYSNNTAKVYYSD